jgi:hypothetical protein
VTRAKVQGRSTWRWCTDSVTLHLISEDVVKMSVDILVIVGGNKTADIEAMKAIYGGSATIRTARTADDLVAAIKSNSR